MISRIDLEAHWTTKSRVLNAFDIFRTAKRVLGPNSVVGLTNCKDQRYEAVDKGIYDDLGNAFYSFHDQVMVVKSQEVKTKDGDLLVVGLPSGIHLQNGRSLEDSIKEASDSKGVVIATTPYHGKSRTPEILIENPRLFAYLDGIEVRNGNMSATQNEQAVELYTIGRRHNGSLGAIGSSDAHRFADVGRTYFETQTLPDLENLDTPERVLSALRDAVRQSNFMDVKGTRNYVGAVLHGAIIGAMIATDKKVPKSLQRRWPFRAILDCGDKEALLS